MPGNVWDLRPDDQTVLVAEIVEILIVLIVSKTDRGCAQLHNQGNILLVILSAYGIALLWPVLVARHAVEGILCPV